MRDRLIELLLKSEPLHERDLDDDLADGEIEAIADHLLAEGVIVPPVKIGQTCFEPYFYRKDMEECRVSSITQKADGSFKIRLTNLREKWVFEITPDKIGKTFFLTKEEAEKALAERSANGT
jgi:hypothetical protein